jgi:hypothetical protein
MNDLSNTLRQYATAEAEFQHIIPSGQLRMSPYALTGEPKRAIISVIGRGRCNGGPGGADIGAYRHVPDPSGHRSRSGSSTW